MDEIAKFIRDAHVFHIATVYSMTEATREVKI